MHRGRAGVSGAAVVGLVVAVLLLPGCGSIPVDDPLAGTATPSEPVPTDPSAPASTASAWSAPAGSGAAGAGACDYTVTGVASRPVQPPSGTGIAESGTATARIRLTGGTVTLTLDRLRAPCTVHSFESLARQRFFDGTRCHRLVDAGIYLLQCGDPSATGSGGPGYSFADETDGTESYTAGVVAMANGGPNTNGSQFFLVYADSTALDDRAGWTIFGRMDPASVAVVARIAAGGQDGSFGATGGGRPATPADIAAVTLG